MFVEVVEEGVHLCGWNNFGEESEIPIGGKYFYVHTDFLKVFVEFAQMHLHELRDQRTMLYVARQPIHVDISHFIVFDQCDE